MSHAKPTLLADGLAASLSDNAALHLRQARIRRIPEQTSSTDALRAALLSRGFPAPESILQLEARAGGAAFPRGKMLGAWCFLRAPSTLRPKDLPRVGGEPLFPIHGDPEQLEGWESPFWMMDAPGAVALFDAPHGPVPAFASLEQLVEIEALAPLSEALHVVRVDALCGELVAGLVGALPHPPATGDHAAGFVGEGVWVKELRFDLHAPPRWSRHRGTFLLSEQTDLVVDAMSVLLEEGYALTHEGPTGEAPAGGEEALSFAYEDPELGYRTHIDVSVWGRPGAYVITHRRS